MTTAHVLDALPLAGRAVALRPPLDPDAPTARRLLEDELARPVYRGEKGLLQRAMEWVVEQLDSVVGLGAGMNATAVAVVTVLVVAVIVTVALVVAGPVRRARAASHDAAVLTDDARTSADIRASAERAAASGDLALATVERFRAVARSLEERAVLDDAPGRTAEEVADAAALAFPAEAADLRSGARTFDAVMYGGRRATTGSYDAMVALDTTLASARPARTASGPLTVGAR